MVPRVLMFGWEFPPQMSGGLGTACLGLTRALAQRDVQVTFVLPKKMEVEQSGAEFVFADRDSCATINFRTIDTILAPYVSNESYRDDMRFEHISLPKDHYGTTLLDEVRRYALRARLLAAQEDFDVIHAHDWLAFFAGLEAKNVSGKPLILHMHATEFDRTGGHGLNQTIYDIERYAMERADVVIAVSQLTKNTIVKHYGIPESRIEVVHNGIEKNWSTDTSIALHELKSKGTKIVLFLGRITIQKGPDYFLQAAKRVLDVYDGDVVFVMNGTGDMQNKMMMQAASMGISDKVIFSEGFGEKAMKLFRTADLFVMPSVSEPFGLVPLEAITEGTPALISRQSGVSEVLQHALKVDFWDIDDMVNKMVCVLEHDSLPQVLLENSQQEVKKISWGAAAGKCVTVYNKLIDNFKKEQK